MRMKVRGEDKMCFKDLVHGAIDREISPDASKFVLQKLAAIPPAVCERVDAKTMLAFVRPKTFINVAAAVGIPAKALGSSEIFDLRQAQSECLDVPAQATTLSI